MFEIISIKCDRSSCSLIVRPNVDVDEDKTTIGLINSIPVNTQNAMEIFTTLKRD